MKFHLQRHKRIDTTANTALGQHGQGKFGPGAMWPWEIDTKLIKGVAQYGLIAT